MSSSQGTDSPPGRQRPHAWRVVRDLAIDITPLRESRDYRFLFAGQAINSLGNQIRMVTIPYLVFLITRHSSLAVGLVSLAQFVPALLTSIPGGTLADMVDRRRLLMITQVLLTITTGALTLAAFVGTPRLWFVFVMVAIAAAISAVDQPTRSAVIPRLVGRQQIANALAINQSMFQFSAVAGPSLAGVILASLGVGPALLIGTLTFIVAFASLLFMAPMPPARSSTEATKGMLASIGEGFAFLKSRPVIRSTFLIDINAMFFGGPRALFPALALDVFKVGQTGLGMLYAAPGVGALVASLMTGWMARVHHQGRAVLIAICVWGAAITAFGLVTRLFWLSLLLVAIAYAADAFSAIFRATILQVLVPDRLRGRLSAIHWIVVTGGPQLGNVESGVVAQVTTPEFSVVSGGIAAALGALLFGLAVPAFARYDAGSASEVIEDVPAG